MCVKEKVEAIPAYGPAPVEDFYRSAVIVAWNQHLGAEVVPAIGGHEAVAGSYLVTTCGLSIGILAAAF